MTKKPQMNELYVINDLESLKVISDPFRMDILRLIGEANVRGNFSTVKEISEALDLPPTKLYYHINLLEKHGLILVGDTKVVSGIIEKKYQVAGENFTVDQEILATAEGTEDEKLEALLASFRSILDGTYQDVKKSLTKAFQKKKANKEEDTKIGERSSMQSTKSDFYLTPKQAEILRQELKALEKKYNELSSQNFAEERKPQTYMLSIVFAPLYHKNPPKDAKEKNSND